MAGTKDYVYEVDENVKCLIRLNEDAAISTVIGGDTQSQSTHAFHIKVSRNSNTFGIAPRYGRFRAAVTATVGQDTKTIHFDMNLPILTKATFDALVTSGDSPTSFTWDNLEYKCVGKTDQRFV